MARGHKCLRLPPVVADNQEGKQTFKCHCRNDT